MTGARAGHTTCSRQRSPYTLDKVIKASAVYQHANAAACGRLAKRAAFTWTLTDACQLVRQI